MGTETHKIQEDPAEGSRETINRELKRDEHRHESGARKHEERRPDGGSSQKEGTQDEP